MKINAEGELPKQLRPSITLSSSPLTKRRKNREQQQQQRSERNDNSFGRGAGSLHRPRRFFSAETARSSILSIFSRQTHSQPGTPDPSQQLTPHLAPTPTETRVVVEGGGGSSDILPSKTSIPSGIDDSASLELAGTIVDAVPPPPEFTRRVTSDMTAITEYLTANVVAAAAAAAAAASSSVATAQHTGGAVSPTASSHRIRSNARISNASTIATLSPLTSKPSIMSLPSDKWNREVRQNPSTLSSEEFSISSNSFSGRRDRSYYRQPQSLQRDPSSGRTPGEFSGSSLMPKGSSKNSLAPQLSNRISSGSSSLSVASPQHPAGANRTSTSSGYSTLSTSTRSKSTSQHRIHLHQRQSETSEAASSRTDSFTPSINVRIEGATQLQSSPGNAQGSSSYHLAPPPPPPPPSLAEQNQIREDDIEEGPEDEYYSESSLSSIDDDDMSHMTPTDAPKGRSMFQRSPIRSTRKRINQNAEHYELAKSGSADTRNAQQPPEQSPTAVSQQHHPLPVSSQPPTMQQSQAPLSPSSSDVPSNVVTEPQLFAEKKDSKLQPSSFASTSRRFSDMTKGSVDLFWQQLKRLNSTESVFFGMPPIRRHLSKESSTSTPRRRRRRRASGRSSDDEDDEHRRRRRQERAEEQIRDAHRVNMVLEQIKSDERLSAAVDAFGSRSIYQQSMWYVITFYITYLFATVDRLIQYKTGQNVYVLVALHVLFVPLQVCES